MPIKRLKVLFITGGYPTKEEPIGSVYVREHAKAVQLYDDVVVLHWAGSDHGLKGLWRMEQETDENLTEGIPTYRVCHRRLSMPKTSYLILLWGIFQAFRQIVKQGFCPDIIHAHVFRSGVPAVMIGKLYRIPVIITEHWTVFPRRLLSKFEIFEARFAFRWAKLVLPVSHALQKAIEKYGVKAKFHVIPNVVDTSLFYPRSNSRNEDSPKRILFVGLLTPVKGVPYLLKAFAELKKQRDDWHFDIVGDGPSRKEYEEMILDLGIVNMVTFHGLQPKHKIVEFMRNCDFLVQASLCETFGITFVEAMACGKPVIGTCLPALQEIINQERGILVSLGEVDSLRFAINHMLDHYQNYSSEKISQYVKENFSYEIVGKKLDEIYRQLIIWKTNSK